MDKDGDKPKVKMWEHLAIRPATYKLFTKLNTFKSQNAFVEDLLFQHQRKLAYLKKKRLEGKAK